MSVVRGVLLQDHRFRVRRRESALGYWCAKVGVENKLRLPRDLPCGFAREWGAVLASSIAVSGTRAQPSSVSHAWGASRR